MFNAHQHFFVEIIKTTNPYFFPKLIRLISSWVGVNDCKIIWISNPNPNSNIVFWKSIVENPRNHFAHWNRCRFFQASYFIIVIKNRQEKIRRQHLSHLCYNSHFCSESFKLPIFHQKISEGTHPHRVFLGGICHQKKLLPALKRLSHMTLYSCWYPIKLGVGLDITWANFNQKPA